VRLVAAQSFIIGRNLSSAWPADLAGNAGGPSRPARPKGDRLKIGMSGKFLPFKYYGATGNAPAYGYKEE
jgi:hypothetical protein